MEVAGRRALVHDLVRRALRTLLVLLVAGRRLVEHGRVEVLVEGRAHAKELLVGRELVPRARAARGAAALLERVVEVARQRHVLVGHPRRQLAHGARLSARDVCVGLESIVETCRSPRVRQLLHHDAVMCRSSICDATAYRRCCRQRHARTSRSSPR